MKSNNIIRHYKPFGIKRVFVDGPRFKDITVHFPIDRPMPEAPKFFKEKRNYIHG